MIIKQSALACFTKISNLKAEWILVGSNTLQEFLHTSID